MIACNTMKKQSNADNVIRTHQLERVPCVVIRLEIVPLINTPKSVPITVPTPPLKSVPPITADAIDPFQDLLPAHTKPAQLFRQKRKPPRPAKKPSST